MTKEKSLDFPVISWGLCDDIPSSILHDVYLGFSKVAVMILFVLISRLIEAYAMEYFLNTILGALRCLSCSHMSYQARAMCY